MLPDPQDLPPFPSQLCAVLPVPIDVVLDLFDPVFLRQAFPVFCELISMPEISINEDGNLFSRQCNIRIADNSPIVLLKINSSLSELAENNFFNACIF